MANYRAIAERFPATRTYLKHRRWARRGDVLAYAPHQRTACFSTDALGFRHSRWRDREFGVTACSDDFLYGVVLGSSHVFGYGLADDAETLPSQLSEMVGFPCVNISFPEADSRTLYSTLLRIVQTAAKPPALVVLVNGGDFTRYCYTGKADPLFGSPEPTAPAQARTETSDSDADFQQLAHFSRFWASQCVALTRRCGAQFCFAMDSTFFEKSMPTETEAYCSLGAAGNGEQKRRFDMHRNRVLEFHRVRIAAAEELGTAPPTFYDFDEVAFIDEFHFQAASLRLIAERIAGSFQAARP